MWYNFDVPTRRHFIRYLSASLAAGAGLPLSAAGRAASADVDWFPPLPPRSDANHHLPPGYRADILLRWGDLLGGTDDIDWDPPSMSAAEQAQRFGYNNDFLAYMPLPRGSDNSAHGLLCVNHEYTNTRFMWPDIELLTAARAMTAERTAVEQAAIGHTVVEIAFRDGRWQPLAGRFNRRLTATSAVRISGPAAGHARLRTSADPHGHTANGILNACSGGKTPWGTVLIAEENFQLYFQGNCDDARERRNHARYGVGSSRTYSWWSKHDRRFSVSAEPHEPNRFGWVVEIDPYDPARQPVKRTALGRFKHEAATCALNNDGRVVVYSGDDQAFEYLYRFVSTQRFQSDQPDHNRDLLDDGVLSVARFHADGTLEWLDLVHGNGPLTASNDFHDQGDVMIETRRAADLLGATRLDRPEDVETNPADGTVYAMLTGNPARHADLLDAANPRTNNRFGHVLRLFPPGAPGAQVAHAARAFRWELFLLAGDPAAASHNAFYPGATPENSWLAAPDNCAFDPQGRLWIASDQGRNWRETGFSDGLWACLPAADGQFEFRRFFSAPIGAEVCGPEFTPDGRHLFLAVQHPGVDGLLRSSYTEPATRWPDFDAALPPRPSVLAIRRRDGRTVGSG